MLNDLNLPTLESRRKEKRLTFLYNIQTGKVPAITKETYLNPIRHKRRIKAKTFSDCVTNNFLTRHQNLNNNCFKLPESNSSAYRHSFFPKTIAEWNELPEAIVTDPSAAVFKNRLRQYKFWVGSRDRRCWDPHKESLGSHTSFLFIFVLFLFSRHKTPELAIDVQLKIKIKDEGPWIFTCQGAQSGVGLALKMNKHQERY